VPGSIRAAEIVQNYTYRRTLISSTCTFSFALDNLKEKALHALFSLRKHSKLHPFLANKIFDAIISPILPNATKVYFLWQRTMQKSNKLEFFKTFKNDSKR